MTELTTTHGELLQKMIVKMVGSDVTDPDSVWEKLIELDPELDDESEDTPDDDQLVEYALGLSFDNQERLIDFMWDLM